MAKACGTKVAATVPPETKSRLDDLKRRRFYGVSWANLIRFVLVKGLDYIDILEKKGKLEV